MPYKGAPLTLEGEMNKLVMNSGISRVQIHYRSDVAASIGLGEQVAISLLRELKGLYLVDTFGGFVFNRFDGSKIMV